MSRGTIYFNQGKTDLALEDYRQYVDLIGKENADPDILKYIEANDKPVSCESSPESRLVIGQQGRLTAGLGANNLRDKPTKNGSKIIGQILESDTFSILDGPVCTDGFAWWQVKFNGLIGWTPEGQGDEYWIQPFNPGHSSIKNTSTDIKKDILGFWWWSPFIVDGNNDGIEFLADGTFSLGVFEGGITGTYTFVADNRIRMTGKSCGIASCEPITWETEVAINRNALSLTTPFDDEYALFEREK